MGIAVFFRKLGVTFFGLALTPVFYVVLRKISGEELIVDTHGTHPQVREVDASMEG